MPKCEVILCKGIAETDDTHDDYIEVFQANGFICKHLPTLRFEFVNLQRLKERLLSPNFYGGLILTSRRAVEATSRSLADEKKNLPAEWNDLPAYCVGPSTLSLARSTLKLKNCLGSECGNATELANCIVAKRTEDARPLLFPCSSIARDTVERILGDNEIGVEKIEVYDTLPIETLGSDLEVVIGESAKVLVFFSPSAVEYTLNALRQRVDLLEKIKPVAIGPTTADAIAKAGLTVRAVSSKPEPRSLLEAIQSAEL